MWREAPVQESLAESNSRIADGPGVEYVYLLNLLAAGQIALYLATKLWFPPFDYPEVPLFGVCRQWPVAVNCVAFIGSLAGTFLARTAADKPSRRIRHAVCAISFAILFAVNQHRLQPWAWQFFILHAWLALAEHRDKLVGWRWLAIGIYFYSAISKLDYAFCTHHGPFLWDGLLQAFGFANGTARWSANGRFAAAAMLPIVELVTAGSLCFARTQRIGLILSLLMHTGLLLALGPWGHDHSAGVLIWNVFFAVQNLLLFPGRLRPERSGWHSTPFILRFSAFLGSRSRKTSDERSKGTEFSRIQRQERVNDVACHFAAWLLLLSTLLAPLGESFGLWDHWPSWSVYSARPERVQVFIHEDDVPRLPEALKNYLQPPRPLEPWRQLRIDRWSLDAAKVPIYPQSRFHLGVAIAVAERCRWETMQVVIESSPDRWTGRRRSKTLTGLDAVRHHAATYRLNALPQESRRKPRQSRAIQS